MKTIRIPPRPSLLADVQRELSAHDPDPRKLAKIIADDVALSASLMKLTNSSFFGLRLKASSVEHAVDLLGLNQCSLLLAGIIARQAISSGGASMDRFWDFSTKRAQAMIYLARQMRACPTDMAHTFGLFCDIGVPLLMEKFPDYSTTLEKASRDFVNTITDLEDQRYNTNHAAVGSLLARTWGLPAEVSLAILLQHDYRSLQDRATEDLVRTLIALALLAEYAIHKYHGEDVFAEWEKGGEIACHFLGLSQHEVEDRFDELHEMFNGTN
ncbi:HDOD domain-containing protein [Undibacterium sp.]|uniref:HDOD domain-containing protein n=1 Tax=Undibacterium sp. TaxID=1914977 RepID=UPI002CD60834|nr:HDOD domain-containing protein [Undibacterium sp.]HTD02549.1 HDOD domain-containing protein [Undibacterium sp.]